MSKLRPTKRFNPTRVRVQYFGPARKLFPEIANEKYRHSKVEVFTAYTTKKQLKTLKTSFGFWTTFSTQKQLKIFLVVLLIFAFFTAKSQGFTKILFCFSQFGFRALVWYARILAEYKLALHQKSLYIPDLLLFFIILKSFNLRIHINKTTRI